MTGIRAKLLYLKAFQGCTSDCSLSMQHSISFGPQLAEVPGRRRTEASCSNELRCCWSSLSNQTAAASSGAPSASFLSFLAAQKTAFCAGGQRLAKHLCFRRLASFQTAWAEGGSCIGIGPTFAACYLLAGHLPESYLLSLPLCQD